jgi:hypothetical protein
MGIPQMVGQSGKPQSKMDDLEVPPILGHLHISNPH